MKLLDDYFALQQQIFDHFGYVENWRVIPLDDARDYFWRLAGEGPGEVQYAKTERELAEREGDCYSAEIYTQRFLSKWVYRTADYTLVCADPHVDGNKFLMVFDNTKERP
jgi:hypothetical protein